MSTCLNRIVTDQRTLEEIVGACFDPFDTDTQVLLGHQHPALYHLDPEVTTLRATRHDGPCSAKGEHLHLDVVENQGTPWEFVAASNLVVTA